MGRSQRLKLNEVTALFRLAREACELGDDPVAWRRHVLVELARLIGSPHGGCLLVPADFDPAAIRFLFSVWVTDDPAAMARWSHYFEQGSCEQDPNTPGLSALLHRPFTRIRAQLCDDRLWYRSAYFNEFRRPLRQDDLLYSHLPLPSHGCASALGFTRALGDPPFSLLHSKMIHLFHQELGRLWTTPPLSSAGIAPPLSHRLAQTLGGLCAGESEKQIAGQLGLSQHTVHNYVKELHRRYNVNSLGELLAKSRPSHSFRPKLGLPSEEKPITAPEAGIVGGR